MRFGLRLFFRNSAQHRAHRKTAAAVAPIDGSYAAGIEEEVATTVRAVRAERRRPVGTEEAVAAERRAEVATGSGQKNRFAVSPSNLVAIDAVVGCPSPSAFVCQFLYLVYRRHTPAATPVDSSSIIEAFQLGHGVCKTVVAVVGIVAVFGEFIFRSISVIAIIPRKVGLRGCFAPSKVITTFPRIFSTNITSCPKRARWETEVDVFVIFLCSGNADIQRQAKQQQKEICDFVFHIHNCD